MSLEDMARMIASDGLFSDLYKDRIGFRPGMGAITAFAMEVEALVKEDPEGEFWEKVSVAQSTWLREYDEANPYVSVADMEAEEKAIADGLYNHYVIGYC
tara:strand:- start:494 stop:793 length:300 start_codon:yes stop_codon:yes gene_type:complete